MQPEWSFYDPVAQTYRRLAVPNVFAPHAGRLVELLAPAQRSRVLDVGAGTGAAALAAQQAAGPTGLVIALDASQGMLIEARGAGLHHLVQGVVPGLPFPDAGFDVVISCFVLSHCASCEASLADMVRVLGPGGKLGVACWDAEPDEPSRVWTETADRFTDKQTLQAALRQALPWEDLLAEPSNLEALLRQAGLAGVRVEGSVHTAAVTVADFVAMRALSFQGRFLQQSPAAWEEFRETVTAGLHSRFGEPLHYTRKAWLATGTASTLRQERARGHCRSQRRQPRGG